MFKKKNIIIKVLIVTFIIVAIPLIVDWLIIGNRFLQTMQFDAYFEMSVKKMKIVRLDAKQI